MVPKMRTTQPVSAPFCASVELVCDGHVRDAPGGRRRLSCLTRRVPVDAPLSSPLVLASEYFFINATFFQIGDFSENPTSNQDCDVNASEAFKLPIPFVTRVVQTMYQKPIVFVIPSTAISMEEAPAVVTQEQIFENIHLHKVVLGSVKQQPLGMRRKLKIVHQVRQKKIIFANCYN